jgi:hypothetical protein
MSTIDLSRQLGDQRKQYAGVRHQQGRVLTDDDFNEASSIEAEELRRTRIHAIGAYGAPGVGFLPASFAVSGGKLDFTLTPGELYLGGLRLETAGSEHFLEQKDWLNFDKATAPAPPAPGVKRTDLVWIEAWQQPVTAVEDSELFEVALGGPDTSARWRTMRRVHVMSGVTGSACPAAWAAALASFAPMGAIAPDMEMTTTATLTAGFTAPVTVGDLCSPPQPGGYLGAENQAIRVQMVDAGHYTWGYNNAAPLYRAKISAKGGQNVLLKLLTLPRDAAHWPLKDMVVELLPWSAALPNGERVSEVAGHLCKVLVSYDPDNQTFEIDTPLLASEGFANWTGRGDKAQFNDPADPDDDYLYVRVWDRGDDLASPAAIPVATTKLGNTGLSVTFNGAPLRPGDHWIISARPAAPAAIVPWQLALPSGAAPNGIRRYRAPLGLIEWTGTAAGSATGVLIDDCRPPFLPLTRIRGCCTVTVGDGIESFGMFDTIAAALASLPPGGGSVCVLPGTFREAVVIDGLHNVTIHGCGPRSRIVAPDETSDGSTAVTITRSEDICVESLALEGGNGPVVAVRSSKAVRLADSLIQFRDAREDFSPWTAVYAEGKAIEIEDNIIEPLPAALERIFHKRAAPDRAEDADAARGGIQLGGGSVNVLVRGNVIVGGMGNGITLGSIRRIDEQNPDGSDIPDIDLEDPCAPCDPTDSSVPPDNGDGPVRFVSAGDLYEIEIADNVIARHGANGIAVVRFFGFSLKTGLELVTVHDLRIAGNRIAHCLRHAVAQPKSAMILFLGYGGISLALTTDLVIEGNVIEHNGRDWLTPVCGVFVLVADGLTIERNVIRANGVPGEEPAEAAQEGIRAGIHVWLALTLNLPGTVKYGQAKAMMAEGAARARQAGGQLRIHGNQVEQPLGRALFLLGAGPMAITDNRFLSEAMAEKVTDPMARTVLVANFGVSREWTLGLLLAAVLKVAEAFGYNLGVDACTVARLGVFTKGIWPRLPTGKLAFNDNQVSFLMRSAPKGADLSSVLLLSLDDVSACDNQFEYHVDGRVAVADLVAAGSSVRTSDNRLAETWGRAFFSVLSFGILNTADSNQSTHCLKANGIERAVAHNLVLGTAFCKELCGDDHGIESHLATGAKKAFMPQP